MRPYALQLTVLESLKLNIWCKYVSFDSLTWMHTSYASAIFRYQREFLFVFETVTFASLGDKHTIKVGKPGYPIVAAEQRGKQVLVSKQTTKP